MDLSANLKGIISQRLIKKSDGKGRVAAIEILPEFALDQRTSFSKVSSTK